MTRTTAVHCATHGLVHVEECPSCLMSRLRAELAEQRREWAEARLEADDLQRERDQLQAAVVDGRLREAALLMERDEAREALTAAEDYMDSNVPGDGWGLLDKGADDERMAALSKARAVLAKAGAR